MFATLLGAVSYRASTLRDSINEVRIWWHLLQCRNDFKTVEYRQAHWKRARDLIGARSPRMVARIERARGLA
jgi:hypothetical protein